MKARIDELERNNGNDSVFGLNSDLDCYDGPGADAGSHEPDFMAILNEGINEAKRAPRLAQKVQHWFQKYLIMNQSRIW